MGEYGKYQGRQIKLGTCESMYYLRESQRGLIQAESGSVNVNSSDRFEIRFRFPWPDEDDVAPGAFDPYDRGVPALGFPAAQCCEHYDVQFASSRTGYLIALPCPEGPHARSDIRVMRNGFQGASVLCQQKILRDGRIVPVLRCGGCGAMWREEDAERIEALMVAFRSEADRWARGDAARAAFYHAIADRIAAGAGLRAAA